MFSVYRHCADHAKNLVIVVAQLDFDGNKILSHPALMLELNPVYIMISGLRSH